MTGPELTFVVVATLVVVVLWAALLFFVPSCLRSEFRYRLWQLRDNVYDDVLAGRLADSELTKLFIIEIEQVIRYSRFYTLVDAWVTPRSPKEIIDARRRFVTEQKQLLSADHLRRFEKYERQAGRVVLRHLLFGSPMGWVLFAAASLIFLVEGIIKVGFTDPISYAKEKVKDAVDQLSVHLVRLQELQDGGGDSQHPISAFQ